VVGAAITAAVATAVGGVVLLSLGRRLDAVDLARARAVEEVRVAGEQFRTLFEPPSSPTSTRG
jgi:hypothetical protein